DGATSGVRNGGAGTGAGRDARPRHQQLSQAHQRQPAPAPPDRPLPPHHRRPGGRTGPGLVPGRGLRRRVRRRAAAPHHARTGLDRLRFQPRRDPPRRRRQPRDRVPDRQRLRVAIPRRRLRCRRLLRGAGTPDRPGGGAAGVGAGGGTGRGPQRSPRAVLLPGQRGSGQELEHPPPRQRPGPQAVLVARRLRPLRRRAVGRGLARRVVPLDDLRGDGATEGL
ncbi:MAG: hypothetical protein AVDCRST_MAG73-1355, partial [uncultured Thermomicrobiales bacterium]